jgi:hypothetical protein
MRRRTAKLPVARARVKSFATLADGSAVTSRASKMPLVCFLLGLQGRGVNHKSRMEIVDSFKTIFSRLCLTLTGRFFQSTGP